MRVGSPLFVAPCIAVLVALLAGCASDPRYIASGMSSAEVGSRFGKPVATGRLPGGEEYWDYTTQPFGYRNERVTFTSEGRVREVRNLLTEETIRGLHAGMTPGEVLILVGPSAASEQRAYAGGTKSWSYRYDDLGVKKLLHVVFDAGDRVVYHYTEWDPNVYSKGDGKHSGK